MRSARSDGRGQAAITVVEAAVGILLVMSLCFVFVVGTPGSNGESRTQLDLYAGDATTLLVHEQPRHEDQTRLAEIAASESALDREAGALRSRVERTLPENVFFRLETPHGAVGHPLPDGVETGARTVPTRHGPVTLRVWYA